MYKLLKIFMALAVHAINGIRYMYHTSHAYHDHFWMGGAVFAAKYKAAIHVSTITAIKAELRKL